MPTTATPTLLTDPGYLFWAPLGSAEPTGTITGSKFTDSWPAAWISVGATAEGSTFKYEVKAEKVEVAEFFDPIKWVTTERSASFAWAMTDWTLSKLKWAMNGGSLTVVSGTGATQLNKFEPPDPGSEVRAMLGWESLDSTVRVVCRQVFQSGTIEMGFKEAPDKATIPVEFNLEVPATGKICSFYTAGTARG